MSIEIDEAKSELEARGYTVLRTKSYRQAQERQRVAEALLRAEMEHTKHVYAWAQECGERERRLADRCTYLYGLAARHGATDEELRGDPA